MSGWSMDALRRVSEMSPEEIHERAHASYLASARQLAEATRRDPYSVGGRGSVLEQDLAMRVFALLEELDRRAASGQETP